MAWDVHTTGAKGAAELAAVLAAVLADQAEAAGALVELASEIRRRRFPRAYWMVETHTVSQSEQRNK